MGQGQGLVEQGQRLHSEGQGQGLVEQVRDFTLLVAVPDSEVLILVLPVLVPVLDSEYLVQPVPVLQS